MLIDNDANITLVAKYLGHSKIDETLNTYSHMYQNRLDSIVNIIENKNANYLEYKEEPRIIEAKIIENDIKYLPTKNNKNKDDLSL